MPTFGVRLAGGFDADADFLAAGFFFGGDASASGSATAAADDAKLFGSARLPDDGGVETEAAAPAPAGLGRRNGSRQVMSTLFIFTVAKQDLRAADCVEIHRRSSRSRASCI